MATSKQSPGILRARQWLRRVWPDAANEVRRDVAEQLYRDLVNQARMPVFYRELGVPDTPEGRFEMVGLHVALLVRRLRAAGTPGRALAQELFDVMFADMDESPATSASANCRSASRSSASPAISMLACAPWTTPLGPCRRPCPPMLRTNVYHGGIAPGARQLDALAGYVVAAERGLRGQRSEDLLAGQARWTGPAD